MTAPKLATTRPAALTGRVGQGGDNRVHDVALVQALLGLKRAKNGRMYLRDNHVTGKYDRATAEALLRFRMDQRDMNIKQPLNRIGPMLNRLAQSPALAVFEGTATPYKLATLAEPGEIKGEAAKLLSAERKVALKEMMKEFISDWGIALDVEIKKVQGNNYVLAAHFTPRNLWVDSGGACPTCRTTRSSDPRPRHSTKPWPLTSRRAAPRPSASRTRSTSRSRTASRTTSPASCARTWRASRRSQRLLWRSSGRMDCDWPRASSSITSVQADRRSI